MQNPAKVCPVCRTVTPIHAPACHACGHRFRTHFAPNPTQCIPAQPHRKPAMSLWMWLTLPVFVVCGLCGIGAMAIIGPNPRSEQWSIRVGTPQREIFAGMGRLPDHETPTGDGQLMGWDNWGRTHGDILMLMSEQKLVWAALREHDGPWQRWIGDVPPQILGRYTP